LRKGAKKISSWEGFYFYVTREESSMVCKEVRCRGTHTENR